MPAVKSSLIHPRYKTEYRVRNWREYEQGLRAGRREGLVRSGRVCELDLTIDRRPRWTAALLGSRDRSLAYSQDRVRAPAQTDRGIHRVTATHDGFGSSAGTRSQHAVTSGSITRLTTKDNTDLRIDSPDRR